MKLFIVTLILLSFKSLANSDFDKFENSSSVQMKCIADDGQISNWSFDGGNLIMDIMYSFPIDGEMVKKKENENAFLLLLPDTGMETYVNFDSKIIITRIMGMNIETKCY